MVEIFPYRRPVTGEQLIGREDVVRQIIDLMKGGQSVMLTAPRRYGKTSVVLEVINRLKNEGLFVGIVDLFDVPSREKLAEKIVNTTLKNKGISGEKIIELARKGIQKLRGAMQIKKIMDGGYEIVLSFAGPIDVDALLDDALDFPENFSKRHKQKMYFAYDEFGDLERMDGSLIKKMRTKFQLHKNAVYLFSGSQESLMKRLFSDKREAFYGFARMMHLPRLPRGELINYIRKTFKKYGVDISIGASKCITKKTECHPYYTQYLCQIIYYALGKKREVTKDDVEIGYEESINLHRTYFDSLWERLMHESLLQLNICRHIASGDERSLYKAFDERRQNIYGAIASLTRKGILTSNEGGYAFTDPLFKDYILIREKESSLK